MTESGWQKPKPGNGTSGLEQNCLMLPMRFPRANFRGILSV